MPANGFRTLANRFRTTYLGFGTLANCFGTPANGFRTLANRIRTLANHSRTPANRFGTLANRFRATNLPSGAPPTASGQQTFLPDHKPRPRRSCSAQRSVSRGGVSDLYSSRSRLRKSGGGRDATCYVSSLNRIGRRCFREPFNDETQNVAPLPRARNPLRNEYN